MVFTTWVFIVGIIVAVGLYRFTRRKKGGGGSGQAENLNGTGEHEL